MLEAIGVFAVPLPLLIILLIIVVIPSFLVILLRWLFYQRLSSLKKQTKSLIDEQTQVKGYDTLIAEIEDNFQTYQQQKTEDFNPILLIEEIFSQEKVPLFGVTFDRAEYATQTFPKIILYLGIYGFLLGMGINLYFTLNANPEGTSEGNIGLGLAFILGLAAFVFGLLLILMNFICNTHSLKKIIYNNLLLHLDNLSTANLSKMEEI